MSLDLLLGKTVAVLGYPSPLSNHHAYAGALCAELHRRGMNVVLKKISKDTETIAPKRALLLLSGNILDEVDSTIPIIIIDVPRNLFLRRGGSPSDYIMWKEAIRTTQVGAFVNDTCPFLLADASSVNTTTGPTWMVFQNLWRGLMRISAEKFTVSKRDTPGSSVDTNEIE